MEEIKITRLNGAYYRLSDNFGEIEFSRSYDKIKSIYDNYVLDKDLQEEMYSGYGFHIVLEKEVYDNGRLIDNETLLEYEYNW